MPALIEACLAGFWPQDAVKTWPIITSETSDILIFDLLIASLIAIEPKSAALILENEPLKDPTGVLAALTITTSDIKSNLLDRVFFSRNFFDYTAKSPSIFKAEINNKIQKKRLINISLKLCTIFTPIGTETNVPRVIKKKGITLIKPIEY